MIKRFLSVMLFAAGMSASACWFTELNFNRHYIAKVNTTVTFPADAVWTGDPISCPPAGIQDMPAQIWIKLQPRSEEGAPAITEALLQYKKLPSGTWTTFKTLRQLNWTMDFSKPVQLFGPNVFDPPGAAAGNEYLVRLWFSDGVFENADLDVNAPEGGNTVWRNQWVTKITISGKRRPQ
jgi:hypothetical protein